MNRRKFKAFLALHGENYESLGKLLELERGTIEAKAQNKSAFSFKHIKRMKEHYQLTEDQVYEIFIAVDIEKPTKNNINS